ncbi:MAG: sensor histidine kinase [Thermodesulfobacteriota bacterium]
MSFWQRIKPDFWEHHDVAAGLHSHLFNLRRIWLLSIVLIASAAIIPVFFLTVIDYRVTRNAIESENINRSIRLVSNARRTVSFFILERQFALQFLVRDNSLENIGDQKRLDTILENLKESFGRFTDLEVVDTNGTPVVYSGPYDLGATNYRDQNWFKEVLVHGDYISDIFMGFRMNPHMVIAVKHQEDNGSGYVLRATVEASQFHEELLQIESGSEEELLITNHEGILQTPSERFGSIFGEIALEIPKYSESTRVIEAAGPDGESLLLGYAYLENTPFILMAARDKSSFQQSWYQARDQIMTYLVGSIAVILIVVLVVATYLVSKIHTADQNRVAALHKVEYINKMASIGRLSAGVAHEINNPLAIINEKTGLMKDLLLQMEESPIRSRIETLADAILQSVNRCSRITRRLLNFARHSEAAFNMIDLGEVIDNVTGFLNKEAEYRGIQIDIDIAPDIPLIKSDRGKLEQIFLNLMNNAFAALSDGGHLTIKARKLSGENLRILVIDDGCGIPPKDLPRVFEPFFSTRTRQGGTGLGLSITRNLVEEIGGTIDVESQPGEGTRFSITLPFHPDTEKNETDTSASG